MYLRNLQRQRDAQTLCSSWHFIIYLLLLKIQIYNEDRYEDINILGTRYLVLLDANLGARQAHDTSVRLIFPALESSLCLRSWEIKNLRTVTSEIIKGLWRMFRRGIWQAPSLTTPYPSYSGKSWKVRPKVMEKLQVSGFIGPIGDDRVIKFGDFWGKRA